MKRTYRHITILTTAAILLSMPFGCTDDTEIPGTGGTVPVAVNMTRAYGTTAGGEYCLMFWTGEKGKDALSSISTGEPWFNSLSGQEGEDPVAGEVDYYPYDGEHDYPVLQNENGSDVPAVYPFDNSPIHAVGFYPSDSLILSADKKALTLNTEIADALPGLVDVCSTQIESGTETAPFTSSKDNELQFGHTQVKLNFKYGRTEDLNGRISLIKVTMPGEHLANNWIMGDAGGYKARHDAAITTAELLFASERDFYEAIPGIWNMFRTTMDAAGNPIIGTNPNLYVLPGSGLFSGGEGTQQYIAFRLNAEIISNEADIPRRVYDNTVTVPLTDESGAPWTETVKAGDAFTITITFDNKKLALLAQKTKWEPGGYVNIPINPSN